MEAMLRHEAAGSPAGIRHIVENEKQAWCWLARLRDVLPAESSEFSCCFESVDSPAPSAWIAIGRSAEITCDVRDGVVVGQVVAGGQVLAKQMLFLGRQELPYVKVFSAMASLLRAERGLRSTSADVGDSDDPRDARWFGGWKYMAGGTTVAKAATFTLPKLALQIDSSGVKVFNWGGLPAELIHKVRDKLDGIELARPLGGYAVLDDRLVPPHDEYIAGAETILQALAGDDCEKVVLSRKRVIELSRAIDPIDIYARLVKQKGHAFQYLMTLDDETWVGISPELLLRNTNREIETKPLAGSRRRGKSQVDDAKELHSLLTSEKDSREHEIAASLMFRQLQRVCAQDSLKVVGDRAVTKLAYIQHLATEMTGQLDPAYDSVDALSCIYPPATILGKPEARADEILRACEPFERSFFTGGLGMMSSNGDCEIALCIRSASIVGHELHLYAGSGYVEGSVPEDEWRETEAKMHPFIDVVMGMQSEGDRPSASQVATGERGQ